MKFSAEQIEKAKQAGSAEELLALAKEENCEMTADEAAEIFDLLHSEGALSDEALDNVAGGCGSGGYDTNLWQKSVYFWDHVGMDSAVSGVKYAITSDNGYSWIMGKMTDICHNFVGQKMYKINVENSGGSYASYRGLTTIPAKDWTLYKHAKYMDTGERIL